MPNNENRHEQVLNRLYDKLENLEPGTDEYDKVLGEITKVMDGQAELIRIEDARSDAKKERVIKVGTFIAGLALTPAIDYLAKKGLAKFIGTIEQMETFTSTPGRSIGSWFRWK